MAKIMEALAPNQWAFTGGQALGLYENIYRLPRTRVSHDIDVVVPKAMGGKVAQELATHFQSSSDIPVQPVHAEIKDVLVANGRP